MYVCMYVCSRERFLEVSYELNLSKNCSRPEHGPWSLTFPAVTLSQSWVLGWVFVSVYTEGKDVCLICIIYVKYVTLPHNV